MAVSFNVLGQELRLCSQAPKTGYYRDGRCRTDAHDRGTHTVCVIATEEFLAFSAAQGNDLSTPVEQFDFPGLNPGDKWCLCAQRWKEALDYGAAPQVLLQSTHINTLEIVDLDMLLPFAVDLPRNG